MIEIEEDRIKAKELAESLERPSPSFTELFNLVKNHVEIILSGEETDDDNEHYIYEQAIRSFYREEIWKEINKSLR